MKKARYAKRLWEKIPEFVQNMTFDLSENEIFIPYSFEDWNLKKTDSNKIYILNLLLSSLNFRKNKFDRTSIGWINLSRISNSSIFTFDDKDEYNTFFSDKFNVNHRVDNDGWYFYLEEIIFEDLPGNIKKVITNSNIYEYNLSNKYYVSTSGYDDSIDNREFFLITE